MGVDWRGLWPGGGLALTWRGRRYYNNGQVVLHPYWRCGMRKRSKLIQMRVTEIEHGFITSAARRAGLTTTRYLVGLAYGGGEETGETSHAEVPAVAAPRVSVAPGRANLAELASKLGMRPAADLLGGGAPIVAGREPEGLAPTAEVRRR